MDEDELDMVLASVPIPGCSTSTATASSSAENVAGTSESTPSTSTSSEVPGPSVGKGSASGTSILVNPRQRGNPVLKHIRNVPWEYAEIVPDYVMGATTCALYLSVRYYNLHPDYIHDRLKELRQSYILRVLLVQIDVPDPYPIMKTLTHIAMLADLTIMPCHTVEEAGKMLETYKIYENKPPDLIQEKQDSDSLQQVIDALTTIRSVNKTDAVTLLSSFGTLAKLVEAEPARIALCPGIGPQKAVRIHAALHEPFKSNR
ncbi:unnamed protein product [Orchesella dallaii]|uniref:ERCC1-like central domain-containing protein n=1 Tax=Orchesella dallaii TaxID=48710 RepID=A0ABP1RTR2_9HEXA